MFSILELPEEIILECCKKMDFATRVNLKKTCKFMNNFLFYSKISDEKVKMWQEKVKLMIGLGLLGNLMECKKLDISKTFDEKIYIDFDDTNQYALFSFTPNTGFIWGNLVKINKYKMNYVMNRDAYYHEDREEGKGKRAQLLFFAKDKESFTITSNLLYDLYLSAICNWEQKDKSSVENYQISDIIQICFEKESISLDVHQFFQNSPYLNIPFINIDKTGNWIEKIKEELIMDMQPYFFDGEEAVQFMKTCSVI
jgi:hypothetical protein